MLERTITKIGSLMAVGFGEAGSEIISKNIEKCSFYKIRWRC